MRTLILLSGVLALAACTDAEKAKLGGLGDPARITCYSAGQPVFDDYSTGKVSQSENSDGYYFRSQTTGKLIEMSGDCRIIYNAQKPAGFKAVM